MHAADARSSKSLDHSDLDHHNLDGERERMPAVAATLPGLEFSKVRGAFTML